MTNLPSEPFAYASIDTDQLHARIAAAKRKLGGALCILGHHYQSDDVIQYADFIGDSLKLSQQAATRTDAKYIVFCGVHFMAESADILSQGRAAVVLPNMTAGCGMADMADDEDVAQALDELRTLSGGARGMGVPPMCSTGVSPVSERGEGILPSLLKDDTTKKKRPRNDEDRAGTALAHTGKMPVPPGGGAKIVPVTYVNSTAAIKAITARAGGACCTSSNVRNVFAWALAPAGQGGAGADKVFAIPDRHLGLNTAITMGYREDDCVLYDPKLPRGGLSEADVLRAKFILWNGQCYVHQKFKPQHVAAVRARHPGIRVMVHPECPREVVALADASGSTEQIIQAVTAATPGSAWAIGTESNLVNRLAKRFPDRFIRTLADTAALCIQMARIDAPHLLWVLDNLAAGRVVNQVTVAPDIAADARIALERMIAIKAVTS